MNSSPSLYTRRYGFRQNHTRYVPRTPSDVLTWQNAVPALKMSIVQHVSSTHDVNTIRSKWRGGLIFVTSSRMFLLEHVFDYHELHRVSNISLQKSYNMKPRTPVQCWAKKLIPPDSIQFYVAKWAMFSQGNEYLSSQHLMGYGGAWWRTWRWSAYVCCQ